METRIALVAIIVKDRSQTTRLNELLMDYGQYILGRMGLPHQIHNGEELAIISIAMEAPQDAISALSGKLGMLKGVTSKVIYS